jgi:hypothetical protein
MLAPGDFLTTPPTDAPAPAPQRPAVPSPSAEPTPAVASGEQTKQAEKESDSFLKRLLRALGAIHT